MQLEIINEKVSEKARKVGLMVVMNKRMMQEYRHLFISNEE
jgi:predicted CoA-binding protein